MLWYCRVTRIDGDYAMLYREDDPSRELIQVARALLPDEIFDGCRLRCENFIYELVD